MIEIKIRMSDFNYESAMEEYLPIITQKLASSENAGFLAKTVNQNSLFASKIAKVALAALPQNNKDEIAVAIIEKYKDDLEKNFIDFATSRGLSFKFEDVQISSVD